METITVKLAAELLQMTRENVYHLIKKGKLKAVKPGRDWMIDPASVEEYLADKRNETAGK